MTDKRVLALLYPGCIGYEIQLALEVASRVAGVETAAPERGLVALGNGLRAHADLAIAEIDPARYDAVIVPGGDPEVLIENDLASAPLRALDAKGALIAAICAGPLVLAKAGVLRGRRFTHGYGAFHRTLLAPFWEGARYEDAHVVEDGTLITAQPQGTIELAIRFASRLGALEDDDEARYRARYARGEVSMRESMERAVRRGALDAAALDPEA